MKKITLLILLLMISAISCYAQRNPDDTIEYDLICINTFSLNQTENSLKALIGNPNSIENFYSETQDRTEIRYNYSVNSFDFYENQLESFILNNSSFYLYNPNIKVGNNISNVNAIFPNSYQNRSVPYYNPGFGFIGIDVKGSDGTIYDSMQIIIKYNSATNIITSIYLWTD